MAEEKVEVFKLSHEDAASLSDSTPIHRQDLITSPQSWVGVAHTRAGLASNWHHHSDNNTYGYVISGQIQIEFGPGGKESVGIATDEAFHEIGRASCRERV